MKKKHYYDYVAHMLRHYLRHDKPNDETSVDYANWIAVDAVYRTLYAEEKDILKLAYGEGRHTRTEINFFAGSAYPYSDVWNTIYGVQKRIAKERGLI